jgi:ABC-type sugar transport system, periplasmic component
MFTHTQTKRLISLLLALLILSAAVSCGDNTGKTGTDTTSGINSSVEESTTTEKPAVTCDLPATDWKGQNFCVLGEENTAYTQFSNFEITADGLNGEAVNDAIYNRNLSVETKYNVKISQSLVENPHEELKKAVLAGDNTYDLAFSEIRYIGTAAQNGQLLDLNKVDYIDFTKPYWNADVNDKISADGKLYFTSSDFSLRDKNRVYILAYNPDVAEKYQISDIVKTVRDGKWTIDLMNDYVKLASGDANGDGVMDKSDNYGLSMDSYNAFATFLYSLDNMLVEKDENDNFMIAADSEHMVNSIEKVMALTCNTNTAFFCNDYNDWDAAFNAFQDERALFTAFFPSSLKNASASFEFDYCIIPFPKYDEAQESYYTMADILSMLFGIPASCIDPSFSGFMLEALSYASTDTSLNAYYNISCKTKYSYNEASGEMLDLIFSGIRYEPAMIYSIGSLFNIISVDLPKGKQNNFASLYAASEKANQKSLDKVILALDAIQ